MNRPSWKLNRIILAGGLLFAALGMSTLVPSAGVIASAQAAEEGGRKGQGPAAHKGHQGSQQGMKGRGGSIDKRVLRVPPEDSDRPAWAGVKGGKAGAGGKSAGAGTKKGDLYGDMVVLLRDPNGVPILTADGKVQVIAFVYDSTGKLVPLTDSSGNLVVIPYTAEGELATTVTLNGVTYNVYPAEVELGRLSVARAPEKVLSHALAEAMSKLTSGTVTVDATGRLVVNGATIDSPLENLALYDKYMTTGSLPGVTLPANFNPAALLAAAADKTGSISVDTVVYINSILGINSGSSYYDFSSYNYDRESTWKNVTATVLVKQADGSYVPTVVNIYQTLFNGTNWVDPTPTGGADDFAKAADDYLRVIQFLHDNAPR